MNKLYEEQRGPDQDVSIVDYPHSQKQLLGTCGQSRSNRTLAFTGLELIIVMQISYKRLTDQLEIHRV